MLSVAAFPDLTVPRQLPHFFQMQRAQLLLHQAVPQTSTKLGSNLWQNEQGEGDFLSSDLHY